MPREDFSIVYQGDSLQADLEDEYLGRMYPYAIPGGVKVLVPNDEFDEARQIVEQFLTRPDIRLVE